jgi:hypothetical protein
MTSTVRCQARARSILLVQRVPAWFPLPAPCDTSPLFRFQRTLLLPDPRVLGPIRMLGSPGSSNASRGPLGP